ncbi:MAG: DUF937 domain-containing protein [Gammaproteobacteria bacterium]|nr:DUF937 domain-containing protein [Gammaproteobacteria bacterium]
MSEIIKIGAKAFIDSKGSGDAGSNLDISSVTSAFSALSGGEGFNIASLMGILQSGNIGDSLQSWLGDGENKSISGNEITNLFGNDNVAKFASELNLNENEAVDGLADALPKMIDSSSSGGSLLDSIGGPGDAINLAKGFFS